MNRVSGNDLSYYNDNYEIHKQHNRLAELTEQKIFTDIATLGFELAL